MRNDGKGKGKLFQYSYFFTPPFFKINLIRTAPARPAHRPEIYPPKRLVLLSAACPTSPASDQTKNWGVGRVYREHQGSVPRAKGSI